jgi:hypothetical protein
MSADTPKAVEPLDRWLWFAGQVLSVFIIWWSGFHFIEAQSAISPAQYVARYRVLPPELAQCDAIAQPQGRYDRNYRCAKFGSSASNPAASWALMLLCLGGIAYMWVSGRRERGIPFRDWLDFLFDFERFRYWRR